jgi:hypothetical protein
MSILEFDGTDEEFEETFMITFQISIKDNFDTVVNFNLKENGDKIPVTKQNRKVNGWDDSFFPHDSSACEKTEIEKCYKESPKCRAIKI